ncbi:MAG TPA: hypothetical protein VK894_00460 [Jiangellales bacterium]|nr:hypothetical protein [Jiangellales bacterium]
MSSVVLAHGVGGRQDLPIPFGLAVAGAAVALLVSFLVLGLAWRDPRYRGDRSGRPLPRRLATVADASWLRWVLRVAGLVATGYVLLALLFGPDLATNPTAGVVYVLLWVGIVPASLLLGPVWKLVNPVRTVHLLACRAMRVDPLDGLARLPSGLGSWPGAVGLFAFVWLELVAPDQATLPVLRLWFAAMAAVLLLGAFVFGSRWLDAADPFEVYSGLVARLSWVGRRADGVLVARRPLENLDSTPVRPGLTAVVVVLLGSTAYDSAKHAPWWARWAQELPLPTVLTGTLGLSLWIGAVAVTYVLATRAAGLLTGTPGRGLPDLFAHSVVPIVVGYVVAHYVTLLVLEGQNTLVLLSDPLGTGADWLGTGDRLVDRSLANQPSLVANLQVSAVVLGHVLGIVSAHDRSVRVFPRRSAVVGQLPLLAVMVAYTVGGLLLLFAG